MVPAAQSGHYKIQNILSVECNENAKEKCTTETIKSDPIDEKTENSLARI